MRDNNRATLCMTLIRPITHRNLQRPTQFGLTGTVTAPRHHRLFETPQDKMPQKMLPILLTDIDDIIPILRDTRSSRKILRIGKKIAPLRRKQINDIEILPLRLRMTALCRKKVNVRIPAIPSPLVHVNPSLEAQSQFALSRFDLHPRPHRLILKSPGDIHNDLTARQPPLATTVNVRISDLSKPKIATNVNMPAIEIGIDLIVMPVRLIGNPLWRAEMDAARDRLARIVIKHSDVNPVPSPIQEFHTHARGLDHLLLLHITPLDLPHLFLALLHRHRSRRRGSDLDISRTRFGILRFSPTGEIIIDKIISRRFGQWMNISCRSSIHLHAKVKRPFRIFGMGQNQTRLPLPVSHKGILIEMRKRNTGDNKTRTTRNNLQRLDCAIRLRILPRPQKITAGRPARHLGLTSPHTLPSPFVTRHQLVVLIRKCDKGRTAAG